jgi:hypothetical protein
MRKPDARATETVGRLKPAWEYLFVPSRRQRGRDKAGHGWRLRQLEPAEIASRFESTTEQVVQVSPDVCVAYPVQWLTVAVKPEYITVSLLQGSEMLCWHYLVDSGAIHDVVEHIDEAILQHEVFDETQQQALYDEH